MVINGFREKKIEVVLITCIMMAAPILFFFLLSSFRIFLTVAVAEMMCITYLGIRKKARNQLKEKANKIAEIPLHSSESANPYQSINHIENKRRSNGSIQLYVPDLNEESLFIIDTFNELEFYEVFLDLKGKEETVMLVTKNPNSLPEWLCGIMAFKIEKFTDLHTQDHITALLEHLVGKTFSISYVTDLDHAYIRVIKERPITTTFPAAANVLIAELLEDFLLVYDAFITEFPACKIIQLVDNALISHLFGALIDFESNSEIIELTAKKKEIETELEYNKVEMQSVRAFFLPKQLRNRYSTIARTNDLYYYDMTEGDLDVAPFLFATMAMQFQNYTTAIVLAVSLLVIGLIIKYLRTHEPTTVLRLKRMVPVVNQAFINGNYAFIQKRGNVIHALAVHQIGEGIPRTNSDTSERPLTNNDGLQKLFRTLTKNRSNVKALVHAKGRIANTNIELVDEEMLDGRRILYNPEPYYFVAPYFVVTQPFVYDSQEKFSDFLQRFDEENQLIKITIKAAFPTLKIIPANPKKVALSFEYFLSQLYSAYSIEAVQVNQSEKDSTIKVGVFKRQLEADGCYLSKKESQGFFELVSGVVKRYQPAQFAIPAKTENTIFLGYAVDTISDTVTTREVGFDSLHHLQTNIGIYGLDRITTVRRIIHELCKRHYNVILIDPQYSERAKRNEPNYCDLPAHCLRLGVDYCFNPLDRQGASTGDFIDGFLTILQKEYGKGDLSRWQFVTKKLKELYETKANESGLEPTLVELLKDLELSEDEEFVEFATPALEELKDVLERILSDHKRISGIGAQTSHPFHMLFNTAGLTVIDLSTFADRNFLSFLLQLLIHSIYSYQRNNPANYQNTVLIIEQSEMLFPEASYLVSYRYRSRVEKFHPLETLSSALIVSMESPSETPYMFNLPRTKIIGRVTRAADIQLVRDTLGLKERGIDSPHPLQESYFRTMKSNHALLYLQRTGEEAQYVPLKVEEVQEHSSSTDMNDKQKNESFSMPQIPRNVQLKQTVFEKDFDTDIDLYYNVLHTLRDMGDRGVIYSALSEMLHNTTDEKQLAKATINLIKKRYVFRKEHTPRDSYKPLTTIRISPKGLQAIEEYEMKKALEIEQSVDTSEVLTESNETLDGLVEINHSKSQEVPLTDVNSRIEGYLNSIEEKATLNDAKELLKQAHDLINNYPQAATSSIVFCYDAIKFALLKLLEIDTDAKIDLDQIVSALISCGISLPVDYSGLQNVIQKHELAIIQGITIEQADIDAIIGDSEIIVAELGKFKLSVRDRIRVIKTILSVDAEKDEPREELEIEDRKKEQSDTTNNFVDKIFPTKTVVGTLTERLHNDLQLNGLLKEIWDITGQEGGLKSVIKNQLILKNTEYDSLGIERAINAMINRGLLCESEGFLQRCEFTENV